MEQQNSESTVGAHSRRRWVPWVTVAGIGALGIGIAAAFVVVPAWSADGEEVSSPTAAPASPSPTALPSCTVTPVTGAFHDRRILDLPTGGPQDETALATVRGEYVTSFPVDDDRVLLVGSAALESGGMSEIVLIDTRDGAEQWRADVGLGAAVVASPQSSGIDTVVLSAPVSDRDLSLLSSFDIETGDLVATSEVPGYWVGPIAETGGVAAESTTAPETAEAFFVTNADSAIRIDADALEIEWTVTGSDHGVGHFEGGVPFNIADDRLFAGGKAFDLATGELLDWTTDTSVIVAAGHVLTTPILYESVGPFTLTGLDTTTGETCWSTEVISVAADDDELWVVTTDESLARIDPATGQQVEDRGHVGNAWISLVGGILFHQPREWDTDDAAITVMSADADWTIPRDDVPFGLSVGGDQLVGATGVMAEGPGELRGYTAPGDVAWAVTGASPPETTLDLEAGVVLRSTVGSDGTVAVSMLR